MVHHLIMMDQEARILVRLKLRTMLNLPENKKVLSILTLAVGYAKKILLTMHSAYFRKIKDIGLLNFVMILIFHLMQTGFRKQLEEDIKQPVSNKPRYKLIYTIENNENDDGIAEEVNVHIDWGGQSRTPVMSYPQELLRFVAARLYIGSPNISGKTVSPSIVHGFTEITLNGNIYRCHPFYANTGSRYDWAFFRWEGFDSNIPGKILMILDLTECGICEDVDIDQDLIHIVSNIARIPHLTNEKWAVIKATESPFILSSELTDDHFVNEIITRIKLDEERICLVPISSLVESCYVVYNYNYCERRDENEKCEHDSTAFVIKPVSEWSQLFIN